MTMKIDNVACWSREFADNNDSDFPSIIVNSADLLNQLAVHTCLMYCFEESRGTFRDA